MPEPLKYMYGPPFFEKLCPVLKSHIPRFDDTRFIHRIFDSTWPDLELKQRTRKVTEVLHHFLPQQFPQAVDLLVEVSKTLRQQNGKEISYPYIFLPDYVERYGINHFDESMAALEEMTQLISAEFAIRPFLLKYPEHSIKQMYRWSKHESPHVRRLASEGCRPRLPWAMALPKFKSNPDPILPILENLKADSSEFVRRSVANNLNDIAKDHPDRVLQLVRKWKGTSKETDWILKHGSRTLLKRGNVIALSYHGFNSSLKAEITKLSVIPAKIKIGNDANLSLRITSKEKQRKNFRIEYAITYLTSTGKASRKVFKLSEKQLEPLQEQKFLRRIRFTDFTTRKHFPGKHQLEIIVNGKSRQQLYFTLVK